MSELWVVVSKGNYTGMEHLYGPYTKEDANAVLKRMIEGQTQHTTKSIRRHRAGDKILNPKV
jgi:hypothetical protein